MHQLIVGQTMSGKTTLAKKMAREYQRKGTAVLVLDPIGDQWTAAYNTTDPQAFLDTVTKSRSCALFIDESGETIGQHNEEMRWLATRARHYGHKSHFITQRAAQLNPTVRTQCTGLWLFNSSLDDAKTLAKEFNKDELLSANQLKQFEYFHVDRFGEVSRATIERNI